MILPVGAASFREAMCIGAEARPVWRHPGGGDDETVILSGEALVQAVGTDLEVLSSSKP